MPLTVVVRGISSALRELLFFKKGTPRFGILVNAPLFLDTEEPLTSFTVRFTLLTVRLTLFTRMNRVGFFIVLRLRATRLRVTRFRPTTRLRVTY